MPGEVAKNEVGVDRLGPRAAAPPHARLARLTAIRRLLITADTLAFASAVAVAVGAAAKPGAVAHQLPWALALLPVWFLFLKLYGLYDRDGRRVSHTTVDDVPAIFHVALMGTLALWVDLKWMAGSRLILEQAALFLAVAFVADVALRGAARRLAARISEPDRVLFVGGGEAARMLAEKIATHPEYGLHTVGYLAPRPGPDDPMPPGLPWLGGVEELVVASREHRVNRILLASPDIGPDAEVGLVRRASDSGVRVSLLPHVVDVLGPSTEIDHLEGVTVLGINPPRLARSSQILKRSLDLVIAVPALVLFAPVVAVLALLVRLDSPGPAFYSQARVGRRGRTFQIWKLRTMVVGAEARESELRDKSADPNWLLLAEDPRVTRMGRFLRQTSLDEVPQLWNVVRGEMSLVGPRPITPEAYEGVAEWGLRRLDLTPGLTGMWQVLGRTWISFEEMIKLDYLYVTSWSLWRDIQILLKTLPVVVSRRGVN